MATKSLSNSLITLVVANLHRDAKEFYVSPLRDEIVATMPSVEKKTEYANIKNRYATLVETLEKHGADKAAVDNTRADGEKMLADYCRVWFKGTVFDACYSLLKKAKSAGQVQYDTALADMKRHALGAPEDTFGRDVRAIMAEFKIPDDATALAKIRELLTKASLEVPPTPLEVKASTPPAPAPETKVMGAGTRTHGRNG